MDMKIPGFYVAHHVTFDAYLGANQVFKVGHTGDLWRRCNTTCSEPASCTFAATVETKAAEEVRQVETGLLRELTRRGNLCRREDGAWTGMAHIPLEELLKILQESGL